MFLKLRFFRVAVVGLFLSLMVSPAVAHLCYETRYVVEVLCRDGVESDGSSSWSYFMGSYDDYGVDCLELEPIRPVIEQLVEIDYQDGDYVSYKASGRGSYYMLIAQNSAENQILAKRLLREAQRGEVGCFLTDEQIYADYLIYRLYIASHCATRPGLCQSQVDFVPLEKIRFDFVNGDSYYPTLLLVYVLIWGGVGYVLGRAVAQRRENNGLRLINRFKPARWWAKLILVVVIVGGCAGSWGLLSFGVGTWDALDYFLWPTMGMFFARVMYLSLIVGFVIGKVGSNREKTTLRGRDKRRLA